ncbi:helix-turn-helix transcriptional regulator [Poseidonocella sp. HB161398]|uniref:helix-turn-helix domain-containing protein n=1 Tax=Poseidonocella sp. HB161398 TaxID=2320855 RepID=UPI001109BB18
MAFVKPTDTSLRHMICHYSLPNMAETAPYPDVAQRVRWHRTLTGLNQDAYAKSIGAKRSQISNWELGLQRPSVDFALALSDRYGLTLDFIYRGRDEALPLALLEAWRSRLSS